MDNIIASYNFDTTDLTKDSTGNFDGYIHGRGIKQTQGVDGGALYFDGSCSNFIVHNFRNFDWGDKLTVSLYVKRVSSTNY